MPAVLIETCVSVGVSAELSHSII